VDAIAILDYGSQYTQLIARRVRAMRVYCEIFSSDVTRAELDAFNPRGIVLSGGPASVYDRDAPMLADHILARNAPVLGICYGMQLLAHTLGGRVEKSERREYGPATITVTRPNALFADLPTTQTVWMSHGDAVRELPRGFVELAHSADGIPAAMGDSPRRVYGLQFHPEVVHTPHGQDILRRFVVDVCGCAQDWTSANFIADAVAKIRTQVGNGRVLCALSGGVDSSVVAALVGRAVGARLTSVFVDHGLLRAGEARQVLEVFQNRLGLEIVAVDAAARFLEPLRGVVDPEQKRKIIGAEFIRVFAETARALGTFDFLAQGTLYPDVIESAASGRPNAARIKTHHNVGGLPDDMPFRLIEPLRFLFKDEVRAVGLELGLPPEVVYRQPFPGPGLAVRILGEVTRERLEILGAADQIVRAEIEASESAPGVWQYFAVLLPVKSVGVMGDARTYAEAIAVRAVTSEDGMTANWARLDHALLERISARIVNEVRGVNRVVYDITSKPPGTIEWE
jgi:GMP synthase (glutamine-hydrolysing)